ncbi:MAG: alpha-2-macroglobulin family protein [Alphaproteobacteria bacterium]|nr:alpha-2-macroglobulin family protein [Alphaproteobacteria bacterium]
MTVVRRVLLACSALLIFAPVAGNAARDVMRFTNVDIEAETDSPRACFVFTRKLAERGAVRYDDYLRFEPELQAEVSARGTRLCVSGFEHGKVYATTLLAGLPAGDGLKTADTERFNIAIPDRKPSVNFKGAAYVLPSQGERALPIDAVNVREADLKILRINDRNLIGEINKGSISSLMSQWDVSRVAELDGELVWEGTVTFDMVRNKRVESAIPVGEILAKPEPGIYVVMAIPREERQGYVYYEATQWMIVTDIGVGTISGRDGMHVFLRSLQDAAPLAGHKVRLVSRNNTVLGSATTDAEGMARFAPGLLRGGGGARPGAVMAFAPSGAFNFLDLTKPAFDLTDRGVGGRPGPGPVDAFIYTDRGVYRPGETVNVVVLARDDSAAALSELPVKLRILKPDGTQHNIVDLTGDPAAGGYHFALPLSRSARTGQWSVQAVLDPKAAPVGIATFQVEDFVPERMEVSLEARSPYLAPAQENAVDVNARFLYGAPGAGLNVTSEFVLMQDSNPYPEFKGYRFGLVQEEWRPRRETLDPAKTDGDGRVSVPVYLDEAPDSTRPLKATVRVSVSESGGRAVSRTASLPVRTGRPVIGIKPRFGDGWLEEGQAANFDIVALDDDGSPVAAAGLKYELFYEQHRYHWYVEDRSWRYRVIIEDSPFDSGDLSVAANAPAGLEFQKDWGRYRLEVSDPQTGAATSVRFRVGWFSSVSSADRPDKLEVTLDKERYRVGETARVFIKPPFAGRVLMTVAGSRVYETRNLDVPREGLVVELPVRKEWDAGAYVTATVFRTAEADAPHRPSRAIGLAWLARDYSARTLEVAIETPERITPRRTLDVKLAVAGLDSGEAAFVTVAAVDQGILQLTRFETPSPADWYFGKRHLGVALRDGYGHLIESAEGTPARIRQGGDEAAEGRHLGGLDASSVKTVSLFSGIVKVGAGGRVTVPLDVPDFNGQLRLMAVAWSVDKVGSADSKIIVRDPVVSQVTLPRFLAPGDESAVTVTVHNVDGPAGAYNISFDAEGAVDVKGGAGVATDLDSDARKDLAFSLHGGEAGVGAISLVIEGPNGLRLERDWEIAVRPAQTMVTRRMTSRLQPSQRHELTADILADFVPGTGEALVTLGNRPDLGLAELLKSLDRYPYGCAEQTTSRALPLLYVAEVAASLGIAEDAIALRNKVQGAVRRVLTMQRSDGSFGLWSPNSPREEWLTAYVMDFLTQAKELGYPVPEYPYKRGLAWLQGQANAADYSNANLPARVYGLHVLARAGVVRTRDLRYVHDVYLNRIPTALGRAQLGAALASTGDRRRAEAAFASATSVWDRKKRFWDQWWFWDYGTSLRDMAGTVYLASLSGINQGDWPNYAKELAERTTRTRYMSTQEKAWLVLAARELGSSGAVKSSVNGLRLPDNEGTVYLHFDEAELAAGVSLANRGDKALWQGITYSGVPRDDLPAEREGFAIVRAFYTLDGKQVNLDRVRQGDTLVAVISGEGTLKRDYQAMVVDLLPAGFELDNASLEGGRNTEEMSWLGELTETRHTELRDDRYVAALQFNRWDDRSFRLAYTVRAVSPGTYKLPAIYVEDMYEPVYFARSRMGKVTIRSAQ